VILPPRLLPLLLAASVAATCAGCGSSSASDYAWIGVEHLHGRLGTGAVRVAWMKRLTPLPEGAFDEGAFQPTEHAFPALDAARDRIYVGTTAGDLFALDSSGRRIFRIHRNASIEAAPAVGPNGGPVFLADGDGAVIRLSADDGRIQWEKEVGGPVRNAPILTGDAVYVATVTDRIVALSQADGEVLWEYEREAPEGFSIEGRAGMTLDDGRIVTGFRDGFVVALDAASGATVWERDTAIDLPPPEGTAPRFLDVDTTPVVVGDLVYVASFSAGLYALSRTNGSVEYRDAGRTGIVGLDAAARWLAMTSYEEGVTVVEEATRSVLWSRPVERGTPTRPVITSSGLVLYGESDGSLLALSLATGHEVARIDAGTGFSSRPVVLGELGAVLSNGGSLYVFYLN